MCARQRRCVFLEDKKVYCQRHKDLIKGEVKWSVNQNYFVLHQAVSKERSGPESNYPTNAQID